MAMSQIIAAGGGANQGAAVLISWAAALLASAFAVIANRMRRKPLLIFAILVEAVALVVSGAIAHVFGLVAREHCFGRDHPAARRVGSVGMRTYRADENYA